MSGILVREGYLYEWDQVVYLYEWDTQFKKENMYFLSINMKEVNYCSCNKN